MKPSGRKAGLFCRGTILFVALLLFMTAQQGLAEVFTVTDTNDSGAGSLRQAILDANASPGLDTILFNIPGSGVHTISPISPLPDITDPVLIDGYSQPGATANTLVLGSDAVLFIEINGQNAGVNIFGLNIIGGGSTIRGLVMNRFKGGGNAGAIQLTTNGGNTIVGNFLGTDPSGTSALGNQWGINILTGSNNNTIGGLSSADRNVISGNDNTGLRISGGGSNLIQNNYVGVDASGLLPLGNGNQGVRLGGHDNTVGGSSLTAGNVISNNGDAGVRITGSNNSIILNIIGMDATGGGSMGNGNAGIGVFGGTGNRFSRNQIFSNTGLGIDLDVDQIAPADGVTPNDPEDLDNGSNNLQNFPVISSVGRSAGKSTISGTLNSTPSSPFTIEFFHSIACDESGNGEGQTYLGETTVTTDSSGNASFFVMFESPSVGVITATATDHFGSTSEFSQCMSNPVDGGTIGTEFTLTGSGFGAKKGKVFIANVSLTVLEWTDDSIRCRITRRLSPGVYDITIKPKEGSPITIGDGFTVDAPEIASVDPSSGSSGETITLGGFFFGTKKGKVTLNEKSCKVLKWTMEPETGESEIEFVVPKKFESGTYELKILNQVGADTTSFSID